MSDQTNQSTYLEFTNRYPEVAEQFRNLYYSIGSKELDEKTRQLVFLGILTSQRFSPGIRSHIEAAQKAGAEIDEIVHAMLLTIPATGLCNFLAVYEDVKDLLKK